MVRHIEQFKTDRVFDTPKLIYSELWRNQSWKQHRKILFRLQKRVFKAIREGDKAKARNLQKLILKSRAARLLAIRQVTQLNAGKKTAGIDGKAKLSFKERFELEKTLKAEYKTWKHQGLREIDISKCFDRIAHKSILDNLIAPQYLKQTIFGCLKAGVNPEFPEQGTPQGGVVSPLLANIALNGIEEIGATGAPSKKYHPCIRYADDCVLILKPEQDADKILEELREFLAKRSMEINQKKTKLIASTDGFDFLGWHFVVQENNGKFRSYPSEENFKTFRQKVKHVVNNSNYGAKVKAEKLAPIVRGWRNYHKYCNMSGSRFSLWYPANRAFRVFNKEAKLNRYTTKALTDKAFPAVPWKENGFINVKGDKSPFDGDITYWTERNNTMYDGATAKTLRKQNHTCGHCGLKFFDGERVHLHHIDGNHNNWKAKNLMVVHESCHDYIHMSKQT
jgi:retron-type reverse transcriptase